MLILVSVFTLQMTAGAVYLVLYCDVYGVIMGFSLLTICVFI
jgi:hypothetical protein